MPKDPFKIYTDQDEVKDKGVISYHKDSDIDDYIGGKVKSESLKISLDRKQLFWIIALIMLGFLVIFGRVFYLQIVRGEYYRELAEGNRIRIMGIPSTRGVIYDRHHTPLTKNIPNFYLQVIPSDLPDSQEEINQIIDVLSEVLAIDRHEVQMFIDQLPEYSYQQKVFKELIDPELAVQLKVRTVDLPGISLEMTAIREYNYPELFSHVLGYTGKMTKEEFIDNEENYLITDYIGKTGLELQYEKDLKGENGKKEIEVDSFGKEKKVIASQEAQIGKNLVTNLDLGLQEILQNELNKAVSSGQAKGGAAIALDPRNGEILALASSPTYNVNKFVRGISTEDYQSLLEDPKNPLFFRTISGEYPSGSTIKPIIASAALQEGVIKYSTTVNSVGGIKIDKWFFPDWKSGGHGITNVTKAISESVNTFFYTIGGGTEEFDGLGVARITQYAKLFGLSAKTGIDLPGESEGFLPSIEWKESVKKERWYIGDTYHLAIGQGDLLVTPLQIAISTSIIANGGTFYKPHLIKEFTNSQDQVIDQYQIEIIDEDFIKLNHIETVQQSMREAVLSGSSVALNSLPVSSAGKTGTAQYSEGTHSWFTCFAPYDNPEIVITVLVERGGEGHASALPVAKNTLYWYFTR